MRPVSRAPQGRRRRLSRRGRIVALAAVVLLFVFVLSLRGIAGVYTDYLWYESLGFADVWRGTLSARASLGLLFTGLFFLLMWGNLFVADRIAPLVRPAGPEEELLGGYHAVVGPRAGTLRIAVSIVFALIAGAGVSGRWREWLLFRHGRDFGITDPQFGWDVGWYVFKLPFLTFVVRWGFAALVIVLVLTAVAHYLNGGIRFQTRGQRVTPQVKAHLSVLLGAIALLKAVDYWLQTFELTTSGRGVADGAMYTDVNAQLPATKLLILISLFAAALLLYNIRRRGWTLPVLAVGLWAFVAVAMGSIYPTVIQHFRVEPDERSKERPYIERNIDATQLAYGLDVESLDFDYDPDAELTSQVVRENADVFRNIRLLDPVEVADALDRLQGERDFYQFPEPLDIDRYEIDGELRQLVLAVRELNPSETGSWVRSHVQFTHGYGLAAAPASQADASGDPVFVVGDLPVRIDDGVGMELEQPQVYFSEDLDGYAIVGAEDDEVDFTNAQDESVSFRYDGDGGVSMGSFLRRAAFALRFGEMEPLISGQITSDSRVLYIRDIQERVDAVAPFISWDSDPYPVVHDGRIVYIVDGYTTTDRFPYSQKARTSGLPPRSGLRHELNYVRNSVKAVVDAYDGSVTLYVMPVDDPIVEAWRRAFPDLFTDYDQMPQGLRDHVRYPEDLFRLQTDMWGRYRLDDPGEWYNRTLEWAVAQDPGTGLGSRTTETQTADGLVVSEVQRIAPYHQLLRLPGREELDYVISRSYVPFSENNSKKELTAFIVGEVTPQGTLALAQYRVASGVVGGPALVDERIRAVDEISRFQTEVGQRGSTVVFGEMTLVPIEDTILYFRPVYVRAENTNGSGSTGVTQLRKVIVAIGERVVFADTLREGLEELVDGDLSDVFDDPVPAEPQQEPPPTEPAEPPVDGQPGAELTRILTQLAELREERDAALAEGDLEEFGRIQKEMDELLDEALDTLPEEAPPDPTITTTAPTET